MSVALQGLPSAEGLEEQEEQAAAGQQPDTAAPLQGPAPAQKKKAGKVNSASLLPLRLQRFLLSCFLAGYARLMILGVLAIDNCDCT